MIIKKKIIDWNRGDNGEKIIRDIKKEKRNIVGKGEGGKEC